MSVFSNLDVIGAKEQDVVLARQKVVRQLRGLSTQTSQKDSPFFSPLLFDPNVVGRKNCENLVGQVVLPVGIVGPLSATLKVGRQTTPLTDMLIPLATTEGALVASISRGCKLLNLVRDVKVSIKNVGMTRAPVFSCSSIAKAKELSIWLKQNLPKLGKIGESTSHHLTYKTCHVTQQDNLVFARFAFDTGEAMGMNMVTIAASAIVKAIIKQNPHVTCPALSSNLCADKKTSLLNRRLGRGRWVKVTAKLPTNLIVSILKTTVDDLLETYQTKIIIGSRLAGLSGRNMHIANVAAAILTATGQDIAHTVDLSQGTLSLTQTSQGISAELSLPTVPVGTVGGGTYLPAQITARNLISRDRVTADILAATIGLACLAGELSGLAALATNTLSSSHRRLAR